MNNKGKLERQLFALGGMIDLQTSLYDEAKRNGSVSLEQISIGMDNLNFLCQKIFQDKQGVIRPCMDEATECFMNKSRKIAKEVAKEVKQSSTTRH